WPGKTAHEKGRIGWPGDRGKARRDRIHSALGAESGQRRQRAARDRGVERVGANSVGEQDDDRQCGGVWGAGWTRKLASVPDCLNPVNSTHARTRKGAQGAEVDQAEEAEGAAHRGREEVESGAARRVVADGAGRLPRAYRSGTSRGGAHASIGESRRTLGGRGAHRRRLDSQLRAAGDGRRE